MTQQEAFAILKAGHNVFLTGAAGSGKTYLLNKYIHYLKDQGVGVGVTASTGIAATHLGGLTIHSWAGIGIQNIASDEDITVIATNRRVAKRFTKTHVLIIDEISMLDAARLDLVDRVARRARGSFAPFGGLQMVLCGDFFQLPPVARDDMTPPRFAYFSGAWKHADFRICYLHERHRQGDDQFLALLDAIRSAAVDDEMHRLLMTRHRAALGASHITKLYSHNANVDAENTRELARLPGVASYYHLEAEGVPAIAEALKRGCLAPEVLSVKKGAAVIFVKNNFEKGYVNGTLGTVSDFDASGFPLVHTFEGKMIVARPESWSVEENNRTLAEIRQVPLRLAWAITIHKSQGMTLDAAQIDLSDAFEKGMGYVALSRVRSLAGIRLLGLNRIALEVHPEISAKDAEFRESSGLTIRAHRAISPKELTKLHADFLRACGAKPPPTPNGKTKKEGFAAKAYSVANIREKYPNAYRAWNREEDERLLRGYHAGATIKALAEEFKRNRGAIASRIAKLLAREETHEVLPREPADKFGEKKIIPRGR